MTPRVRSFYGEHFFFSNRLVHILLALHHDQYSKIRLMVFLIIIAFFFVGSVHKLYQLFTTDFVLQTTVEILQKGVASFLVLSSYSTIYYRYVTIKLIMNRLKSDYENFTGEEELEIVEKYTKETKLYVYVVVGFFNLYIISIISPSILNVLLHNFDILDDDQLTLPVPINNVTNGGLLYYSFLFYQLTMIFVLLLLGCLFYSLYMVFVQHACCQFSIIILKIRRPFKDIPKYVENVWLFEKPCEKFDWIVDIIYSYKNVTEYVDLINCFSQINYLIAVFCAMIFVIFDFIYLFQLLETLQSARDTIEYSITIVGSILVLYLNFYVGQKLLDQSNAVFEEMCKIPFYMLSIKVQKLLLFMITRSGKPCMLSIGGIFVSSHEVFAALMRKALSFAMVYYSVQ